VGLLGAAAPHGIFLVAVGVSFAMLVAGLLHFAKLERTLADDV